MKGDGSAAGGPISQTMDEVATVTFLLPVWGYQFTRRFLEFCLPTLLSPNNIPAIARDLPCRFVLLSSENDEQAIVSHPAWQRLAQLCAVEILPVDDLITDGNHTATITLAFERALRRAGPAMRDTCFIFLMSDYLVADGSLAKVVATVRQGARAVLVGNFQVVAEDAGPLFRARFASPSAQVALRPRDLMQFALSHLHPATIANIVNFGVTHSADCNRLFWQVDENTLIGRFYLMHPIAIRPEVDDFEVGSSWDYSFIPELCPSDNVMTLTDSDDYLVVEMQRRLYDQGHLRLGPIGARQLAERLSAWTTARHRSNAEQTLIFHAGEPPAELSAAAAQFDAFVKSVGELMTGPATLHRQHPYWVGSIAAARRDARRPLDKDDWTFIIDRRPKDSGLRKALERIDEHFLRFPPDVSRMHPLWPDYRHAVNAARNALDADQRMLLITPEPARFAKWVSREKAGIFTLSSATLLQFSSSVYRSWLDGFDCVLFIIGEESLQYCDALIDHARPLLKPGGECNFLIINERPPKAAVEFNWHFTREAARLWRRGLAIDQIQYVRRGRMRWLMRRVFVGLRRRAGTGSRAASYAAFATLPLLLAAYLINSIDKAASLPPDGPWSSVFITLRNLRARCLPPTLYVPRVELRKTEIARSRLGERQADRAKS